MMNEDTPSSHIQSWTGVELVLASVLVWTTDGFAVDSLSIKSHHVDNYYLFIS